MHRVLLAKNKDNRIFLSPLTSLCNIDECARQRCADDRLWLLACERVSSCMLEVDPPTPKLQRRTVPLLVLGRMHRRAATLNRYDSTNAEFNAQWALLLEDAHSSRRPSHTVPISKLGPEVERDPISTRTTPHIPQDRQWTIQVNIVCQQSTTEQGANH